jgi:hypothetical protein
VQLQLQLLHCPSLSSADYQLCCWCRQLPRHHCLPSLLLLLLLQQLLWLGLLKGA